MQRRRRLTFELCESRRCLTGIPWNEVGEGLAVANINQETVELQPSADSQPHHLTVVDETLFFTADDGVTPRIQLWKANGDGAALVAALPEPRKLIDDPIWPGSRSIDLINLIAFNDELVFTHHFAYSWASGNGQYEYDLWKSDGTGEGTQLLLSPYFSHEFVEYKNTGPSYQAVVGDRLYFEPGWYDGVDVAWMWSGCGVDVEWMWSGCG